ncbi:HPP family protein [Pseudonocardia sp. RS11V-5]|uniref:HPP family protein n=1 Tax=Pseudonocardia terrae TaxID=2905831 RepID=UPI001E606F4E|nr:HPP family protein [Pseudonocardia terrae]MCE3550415.1 HPP family protein [Pseudonocardia terrae]
MGRIRCLFRPILAGATLRERLLACGGALAALCVTALLGYFVVGPKAALPFLVAPVGASAVLVFAVPTSPLAQPWSVIGGNVLSALVGIGVTAFVHDTVLAAGLAVGGAIAAMSLCRCLHPPGGAAALTIVIGGSVVAAAGPLFAFVPVGLNSVVLVGMGWLFHRLTGHTYPHRAPRVDPAERRSRFRAEDVDRALIEVGEAFDISREDIGLLLREVETQALVRRHGEPTAGDVMSREVVRVTVHDTPETARALLLAHDVRTLPVLGPDGTVVGTVGLRELVRPASCVSEVASPPLTAPADLPALALSRALTDGHAHAAVIVDADGGLCGMVTQTDLIVALCRALTDAV